MSKVSPFLWFDTQAEEAARFYVSVIPNSKITQVVRSTGATGAAGSVLTVEYERDGQKVTALNGGPTFKPTEAFSFVVECDTQGEVDRYWDALQADGGSPSQCGWLKDRYGVSWQVTPKALLRLIASPDREAARRATEAMLQMTKLDIAKIEAAAAGSRAA
jgi:predicted 3-demethylubiquinone-9 3-methyltransferase (glyoxalase superfamily)